MWEFEFPVVVPGKPSVVYFTPAFQKIGLDNPHLLFEIRQASKNNVTIKKIPLMGAEWAAKSASSKELGIFPDLVRLLFAMWNHDCLWNEWII